MVQNPPLTKNRDRRGSGSSLSSIWRSFRGRNTNANNSTPPTTGPQPIIPHIPTSSSPAPNAPVPSSTPIQPPHSHSQSHGSTLNGLLAPPGRMSSPRTEPSDMSGAESSERRRSDSSNGSRSPAERPRTISQSSVSLWCINASSFEFLLSLCS